MNLPMEVISLDVPCPDGGDHTSHYVQEDDGTWWWRCLRCGRVMEAEAPR